MGKRLYVRNLSDTIDSDLLEEMFSSVGDVISAIVQIKNVRGKDYRVGYVEMSSESEASDGIDRFHDQKKHGLVLTVTEDTPHVPILKPSTPSVSQLIKSRLSK